MGACYEYRDVTGLVDCTDVNAVYAEAAHILLRHHQGVDLQPLRRAFSDIEALYEGRYPGYRACDMAYHDLPHVLDVSLALIRLVDGYQTTHRDSSRLSAELCVVAILVALFHDSGYIRKRADTRARNGAEYTRIHVRRSARFLRGYLPQLGYGEYAELAARLVQFTGYEVDLSRLRFEDARHRRLGELIGTADILAQMSDRCYLDKCRDCLYPEFEIGGVTETVTPGGDREVRYHDAVDLLRKTPGFMEATLVDRLGGQFKEAWRYVEVHFDGDNPYFQAIEVNRRKLLEALEDGRVERLLDPFESAWRTAAS